MCNPRRVEVTATRQIAEAWEREAVRAVELAGTVTGEARVRQALDASVGRPALFAMEAALEAGVPGWVRDGETWRHDVEGGRVVYHVDRRELEIVAVLTEELRAVGEARVTLSGVATGEVAAAGEGRYYDDEWGGHTRARAEGEAQNLAQAALDAEVRAAVEAAACAAEDAEAARLEAAAQAAARQSLDAEAEARRAVLARQAARTLAAVGVRGRAAFHALLALAYRDALVALARRRGASDIELTDDDGVLEITFELPD